MDTDPYPDTKANQTPNAVADTYGVRLRGITFAVERETAQIAN